MTDKNRGSSQHYPHLTGKSEMKEWTLFFTYGESNHFKSMAIVKAENIKEAGNKLRGNINLSEYPNFHIWWTNELEKMYDGKDVIIP